MNVAPSRRLLACYIISAERANLSAEENAQRTVALRHDLRLAFHSFREAVGSWEGVEEATNVVYVPARRGTFGGRPVATGIRSSVLALMQKYAQDAVLYVAPSRVAYLLSGPGFSRQRLGYFVGSSYRDAFALPGWTYLPELATYYGIVTRKPERGHGADVVVHS